MAKAITTTTTTAATTTTAKGKTKTRAKKASPRKTPKATPAAGVATKVTPSASPSWVTKLPKGAVGITVLVLVLLLVPGFVLVGKLFLPPPKMHRVVLTPAPAPAPVHTQVQTVYVNPDCTSRRVKYTIGKELVDINPLNADCVVGIKLAESSGCIHVQRMGHSSEEPDRYCKESTNVMLPDDIKYIRSDDGPLTAMVALQPQPLPPPSSVADNYVGVRAGVGVEWK